MTNTLLREAAHALRDVGARPAERAQVTRARVMTSLHQRRQRRGRRAGVLVPFIVVLAGSSAWAAADERGVAVIVAVRNALGSVLTSGSETPRAADVTTPRVEAAGSRPAEAAGDSSGRAGEARVGQQRESIAASAPERERERERERAATAPRNPARSLARVALPSASSASTSSLRTNDTGGEQPAKIATPASTAADDAALALYRAAHRVHFVDRNPRAALEAWDAYLASAPNGRFAIEARYNRALAQIRLGQNETAARALASFAEGRFGGYRQEEAKALLSELARER